MQSTGVKPVFGPKCMIPYINGLAPVIQSIEQKHIHVFCFLVTYSPIEQDAIYLIFQIYYVYNVIIMIAQITKINNIPTYLRRWLGVPRSFSSLGQYSTGSKLQLHVPLNSITKEFKVTKVR